MKFYFITFFITFSFASIQSPSYETLRAKTMGNAFVAVATGKDALNYNIAGLDEGSYIFNLNLEFQIGDIGSFGVHPTISNAHGDFIREYLFDFRSVSFRSVSEVISLGVFNRDLASIDREPFIIRGGLEFGFAIQNFGISTWANTRTYAFLDQGVLAPSLGLSHFENNLAQQAGIGWSLTDKLSVGIGLRLLRQEKLSNLNIFIANIRQLDSLVFSKTTLSNGLGVDIGGLWEVSPSLLAGASLQNLFLKLGKDNVIPELTIGLNYSPKILQNDKSSVFGRTVNLSLDYENLLLDKNNSFNHINMGVELKQEILGDFLESRLATGLNNNFNYTLGFGIYFLSFIAFDYGTWTEDLTIISQDFQRIHNVQLKVGF